MSRSKSLGLLLITVMIVALALLALQQHDVVSVQQRNINNSLLEHNSKDLYRMSLHGFIIEDYGSHHYSRDTQISSKTCSERHAEGNGGTPPSLVEVYLSLHHGIATDKGFITHASTDVVASSSLSISTTSATTTPRGTTSGKSKSLIEMLGFLVPLALTDSVNPCTFVLYAVMLVSVSVSGSRGRVAAIGAAFIIAVMSGYLILGLGLSEVASFLPRQLVLIIAFGYAAFIIARAVRDLTHGSGSGEGEVCREDDPECKAGRLARMFSRKVSILAAFAIGLLASFTLLPCSAGPYIAFAMIISTQSLIERLALLLAYNIVFVTPLILILIAMLGITRLSGVRDKLIKYSPHISLASGVLLVIVAALMVFQT